MPLMNGAGGSGSATDASLYYLNRWKCWSSTTYKRAIPYGCKYRVNTGAWITVPLGGLAANAISLSTGDVLEIKIPNAPIYDASTSLPI